MARDHPFPYHAVEAIIMHRSLSLLVLIGIACLAMALPTVASAADAVSFVKTELLHCIHPTVNVDKAQVEIDKPTVTEGDTSITRVRVFYEGWIKKDSMLVDVMEKAGTPPLVRAKVIEDSGTGHAPNCKYTEEGWQEMKQ
jgi:hypothetical protein